MLNPGLGDFTGKIKNTKKTLKEDPKGSPS